MTTADGRSLHDSQIGFDCLWAALHAFQTRVFSRPVAMKTFVPYGDMRPKVPSQDRGVWGSIFEAYPHRLSAACLTFCLSIMAAWRARVRGPPLLRPLILLSSRRRDAS